MLNLEYSAFENFESRRYAGYLLDLLVFVNAFDTLHNDPQTLLDGEIKQVSITQCLSKDLEDMTKENFDLIYTQNEEGCLNHNMERLFGYDTDQIMLRALPNRDGRRNLEE